MFVSVALVQLQPFTGVAVFFLVVAVMLNPARHLWYAVAKGELVKSFCLWKVSGQRSSNVMELQNVKVVKKLPVCCCVLNTWLCSVVTVWEKTSLNPSSIFCLFQFSKLSFESLPWSDLHELSIIITGQN